MLTDDVASYIEKQKSPQREILRRLREIVLKTLPGINEKVWMGVPWYDGKCYVVALRDHVNMGFSVKGLSEREMSQFQGKGKLMRHVKFYSLEDVDETKVAKLLRLVAQKISEC